MWGSTRNHPPCNRSFLTMSPQKPRGAGAPHLVDGIPGHSKPISVQAGPVGPLVSTAASSPRQPSHLDREGTSRLSWPLACHPHGHRSVPTLVHPALPRMGEGQTKRCGPQVTSLPAVPRRDAEGARAPAPQGPPGWDRPLGGTQVPAGPAAGAQGGSRGGGLTLLRCGSRVSR